MVILFGMYIIFDSIFFFNGIYQLKILIGKILFNDKSKNEIFILNSKESIKMKNNNKIIKKDKKIHKHKAKFKIVTYNKIPEKEGKKWDLY